MTNKSLTSNALSALKAGLAVIPILPGSKKAAVAWGVYQKRPPTEDEVREMFAGATAIAILCGESSGNLEAIDFDDATLYPKWVAQLSLDDRDELLEKLVVQRTPSGGCHVLYRAPEVEGNQKLAWRDGKIGIETRGSGGYVLAAPSPGYELVQGKFSRIPTLSAKERDILLDAARWYDRSEVEAAKPEDPFPRDDRQGVSCADRFNAETSWADILSGHGWTIGRRTRDGRTPATRPGKDPRDGISATISADDQVLYVFTSNAPALEGGRAYSKFQVYSALEHAGDYSAAARHLLSTRFARETREKRGQIATESDDKEEGDWIDLSTVDARETDWLFKPLLPYGYLAMLQGDPGVGKSTIGLGIAAAISAGTSLFGMDDEVEAQRVLVVSLEDSIAEVIVPRLIAAGANLSNIQAYKGDQIALDVEKLEEQTVSSGSRFVLLDPVIALVGAGRDINKANETREFMARLAAVADRTRACILLVHHMNKASGARALYRSVGSIDFVAAVRSVMMAGHDPDDRDKCAVAHIKCNLGAMRKPIGYEIGEFGLAWTGESDLTAERMSELPEKRSANVRRDDAQEFLVEVLKGGAMHSDDVLELGKEMGYSRSTMFRAKADLGKRIKAEKMGTQWQWRLVEGEDR